MALLGQGCAHPRAYGIPGATQRSPDLALPLAKGDSARALLVLDNQPPPRGGWAAAEPEEVEEQLGHIAPETRRLFTPLLDALGADAVVLAADLEAGGRLGRLFDSRGADDEALDARFRGDVLVGDLRVARRGGYLFVFYRRYPAAPGSPPADQSCPRPGDRDTYCRLVIVREVATRRN